MSPFPDDATREIAAHLTVYDWNLFSNIQVMEFVYQVMELLHLHVPYTEAEELVSYLGGTGYRCVVTGTDYGYVVTLKDQLITITNALAWGVSRKF